jgi:glycerol-3-phosphate acyltransferase PlsY
LLSLITAGLVGYAIGSIPWAFLLVRWRAGVDIRARGSGNVGTLNSFQVSRSVFVGATVLVLDLAKGAAAVLCAGAMQGGFVLQAAAGVCAVIGHNFPVWLRFKGGRGLAPAAGVMLVLSWETVLLWLVLWVLGFVPTRHVNAANALASILCLVAVLGISGDVLAGFIPRNATPGDFRLFGGGLFSVVLSKHAGPLREYLMTLKEHRNEP